ncbi:unnamed protein product [Rotaria sp. Silwood2]|nr:unnamed protein product [Rotaria sp. Silwood2]CAF3857248.1 unnamed protein product [Rotaria sp. Silwood2]CAF4060890.1 unnamed protein product [Rotaria sp. Silwood2]
MYIAHVSRKILGFLTVSYAGAYVSAVAPSSSSFSKSDISFSSHSLSSLNVLNLSPSNRSRSYSTSSRSSTSSEHSCSSDNIFICSIDDNDFELININVIEDDYKPLSSDYELEDIV